jgi:hypothetical protein
MWCVSESFPELARVIIELCSAGRIDIVRAKQHVVGQLDDGQPYPAEALIASVASMLGAEPLGQPQITLPGRDSVRDFLPASLRCQASSVAGVIGKISVQRLREMSRASAANHTRSAGSYRIRLAWRRRTAFSCRSTSSSASFARSLRSTRTARPSIRRTSRQAILSSIRPANHHRALAAGEGQVSRPIEYSSGTGLGTRMNPPRWAISVALGGQHRAGRPGAPAVLAGVHGVADTQVNLLSSPR